MTLPTLSELADLKALFDRGELCSDSVYANFRALIAAAEQTASLVEERDRLVMAVMRGSHREARDFARPRFVEMCPDERQHAAKAACDKDRAEKAEALARRLAVTLEELLDHREEFDDACPVCLAAQALLTDPEVIALLPTDSVGGGKP